MSFDSYSDFSKNYNKISELSNYSNDKLAKIRLALEEELNVIDFKDNFSVITTGSYGRMEASDESDMDFFIICDSQESKEKILKISKQISESIKEYVPKNTGSTGTFGESAINTIDEISSNIGGQDDSNELLTRKILYYSGIISVIHTYLTYINGTETEKVKILSSILDMPVSERIYYIITFGKDESDSALNNKTRRLFELYNLFLEKISDKENRVELESIKKENRLENDLYRVLNDKSRSFTTNLFELTCSISEEKDEILEFLIF